MPIFAPSLRPEEEDALDEAAEEDFFVLLAWPLVLSETVLPVVELVAVELAVPEVWVSEDVRQLGVQISTIRSQSHSRTVF